VTPRIHEAEAELPLDPALVAICASTRVRLASSGSAAVPLLLQAWEGQPSVRHGVIVTLGMMLWYADSTARPLAPEHRTLARRHLLRAAVAEESWLREAFVEAAEWTHDPTYLPLVQEIERGGQVGRKLLRHGDQLLPGELLASLREQFDVVVEEGWVSDEGLARSVRTSFATATASYATHDHRTARAALTAAQVNLGQGRGRSVRPEAWSLLSEGIALVLLRSSTV
jgi:hypothetical protein